ncbi:C1 family peptidase, partial [Nocardioides sp. SOB44]
YPYQASQGSCKKNKPVVVSAKGYVSIPTNETNLKIAVATQGPVSVAVNADQLQFYSQGIFNTSCSTVVNHGVLVVGYGTIDATGAQYWIIKNS